MATNFEKARDFMRAFGQNVQSRASLQDKKTAELRYELIREELEELREAIDKENLLEIADALTDILYVTYGAGHAWGIDLDTCYTEVHRSNMSKLGEDGKPIHREDGKVMKGPGYSKPNLIPVILNSKHFY
jgi:predicted HAD superfamily Cof-like phosphohydrolase